MIFFICLLALLDSYFFPVKGFLSAGLFIILALIGFWHKSDYKKWFIAALIFISLASVAYLLDSQTYTENVIHKLSDWTFVFLTIGAFQLARFARQHHELQDN